MRGSEAEIYKLSPFWGQLVKLIKKNCVYKNTNESGGLKGHPPTISDIAPIFGETHYPLIQLYNRSHFRGYAGIHSSRRMATVLLAFRYKSIVTLTLAYVIVKHPLVFTLLYFKNVILVEPHSSVFSKQTTN